LKEEGEKGHSEMLPFVGLVGYVACGKAEKGV
jgi:hypothetical protein